MKINRNKLLKYQPIKNMFTRKQKDHGVSHGMGEAGYDIRIKQAITFISILGLNIIKIKDNGKSKYHLGTKFCLASAIEEFQMPSALVGVVHDKSTWAREGLSVFNTVIEPGWNGFLTLELVCHKGGLYNKLHIPAGSGIAQVLFTEVHEPNKYRGKYQNQLDQPTPAKRT